MTNLENQPPIPALKSARMKVETALSFLAFGLCNLNFNPKKSVVDKVVESSQT